MVTEEELQNMSPEQIAELQRSNCPFCKIVSGQIPSTKIYEDEKVIAILDINPSKKGHVLILPKEHYAIITVIPPDTFKQMFKITKLIGSALKKTLLSKGFSVFIANGQVAGQQSPHFLFHLIPRDENDSLTNLFNPESKPEYLEEQNSIFASLKNNLNIMMSNHLKREGINFNSGIEEKNIEKKQIVEGEKVKEVAKVIEDKREKISLILQENPDVRDLLRKDVEGFKNLISQNEEISEVFKGVDLEQLSQTLKNVDDEIFEPKKEEINQQNQNQEKPIKKPEVFLGENPYEQKKIVFAYFDEKPKAKELFMKDLGRFKELLATREDVQKIFENVNLDKLSEKLNEVKESE